MNITLKKITSWIESLTWTNKKNVESVTEITAETIMEPFVSETDDEKLKEEKIILVDPGSFKVDEDDGNLFCGLKNEIFSIRIIKNNSGGKEKNKDQMVFVTSLPHKFNDSTFKAMQNYVPQLTDINFSKSHELLITKSAASKFNDLQDSILRFILLHLDREYSWLYEEQPVIIEKCPNEDILTFNLRVQTCHHLGLGKAMFEINGICSSLPGESFPLCMDHKMTYNFSLEKGKGFSWEELLPKIKEVFASHFPAGVKFTGYMQ